MTDLEKAARQALEALEAAPTSWRAPEAITALRQALANEALDRMAENARELGLDYTLTQTNVGIGERAMEAYEAAKQRGWSGVSDERLMKMPDEPVAFFDLQERRFYWAKPTTIDVPVTIQIEPMPLYRGPQPARECSAKCSQWVGLTDEDIAEGQKESWVDKQAFESAVWWAEAKLKEKNT